MRRAAIFFLFGELWSFFFTCWWGRVLFLLRNKTNFKKKLKKNKNFQRHFVRGAQKKKIKKKADFQKKI
jgi:hypothetical protein